MRTLFAAFCLAICLAVACAYADQVAYQYDDAGRLVLVDYGNGKTIAYSYDAAGNLLSRTVTSGTPASADQKQSKPNAEASKDNQPAKTKRARPKERK